MSAYHVKRVIYKTWSGTLTNSADTDQMPQNALLKLQEVKDQMKQSPFGTISSLPSETIDPPVLSVLCLCMRHSSKSDKGEWTIDRKAVDVLQNEKKLLICREHNLK